MTINGKNRINQNVTVFRIHSASGEYDCSWCEKRINKYDDYYTVTTLDQFRFRKRLCEKCFNDLLSGKNNIKLFLPDNYKIDVISTFKINKN